MQQRPPIEEPSYPPLELGAIAITSAAVAASTQMSVRNDQLLAQNHLHAGPLSASAYSSVGFTGNGFEQERVTNVNYGFGHESRSRGFIIGGGGLSVNSSHSSNFAGFSSSHQESLRIGGSQGMQYHAQANIGGRTLFNLNFSAASCCRGIAQCFKGIGSCIGSGLEAFKKCCPTLPSVPWTAIGKGIVTVVKAVLFVGTLGKLNLFK